MTGAAQDEIAELRADEPVWPGWLVATAICIRFYSRLPVPRLPGEGDIHALPDFRLVPRAVPLAGLVIAMPAALVLLAAGAARVDPALAAALAITALVLTTGGLHEDGLADSADGLFGGATPERRLEIMKDSRIGSYGALALGLSLLLRVTALAAIQNAAGPWTAAIVLLAAAALSRALGVKLLAQEAPARPDGAAAAVGTPSGATARWATLSAVLIGGAAGLALWRHAIGLVLGILIAISASRALGRLAHRLIGGRTGDIIGASQQIAEIAVYLGVALTLGIGRP